ncbi:DUF4297 domain-containing protein [Sphaerisporangium sp. NBC_01403]|uniref:dsDNA nuclease domain-containing protein n=1 Tax=Sphaerisporangium sp. NBC_01403 TaxID=2903599 RepID=UPI003246D33D
MGGTDRQVASGQLDLLTVLAQVDTDSTGVDTFERYVWQAKQAVRQWLTCLSKNDGPQFLVCERVEDLVLVYADYIRFLQLKTRDRGSWSASGMCDRGIDSLVRSYTAARAEGLHESATFELWLEGPISDVAETVAFVKAPAGAARTVRNKIVEHGLDRSWVDDFLQRLVIRPDQPGRAHIDAKALWELGALWPALSRPELSLVYERLLLAATAAQADSPTPFTVQAHLAAARPHIGHRLPESHEPGGAAVDAIRNQVLSHGVLVGLTPPIPGASVEQLLARVAAGSDASLLELKMMAAGAGAQTIQQAKELRADMEVERQLLLASRETAEMDLQQLATRVLRVAEATAKKIALSSASNPAAAARPAEAIAADLLSRPADLGQCDRASLFDRDGQLIYGFLGHLSDICHFGWHVA